MNSMAKNLIIWLVLAAILFTLFEGFKGREAQNEMTYSQFLLAVQNERVSKVTIQDDLIKGVTQDNKTFVVVRPRLMDLDLVNDLMEHNVTIEGEQASSPSLLQQLLVASFPILLFIGVFVFFMRQMQGGAGGKGGPMSFAKSKAKLLSDDQINTTFADVAGVDEAKEDVQELVDYLRDPSRFQRLGGRMPSGVLMAGPPGTGKTLLAKAIAGEAKVPFFSISGSDFVEMFVGVGASRVRDMFEQAKKQAPCIIFIDEIDAVGRHRGGGHGGGNDEREQTLNQLLVEMDGFDGNEGIIVIAATNRADVLDKALLRPGRFDRQVNVGLPDVRGREQILKVHMRKVPLDESVNAKVIARGTSGFSGADLANLVNEAALWAAKTDKRVVSEEEFEKARDKIMMGAERRTLVMTDQDKESTAYHEAGHAIVGYLSEEHDPIHKVTIIPRGRALGITFFLPEGDSISNSRRKLLGNIATAYGGRIAEEMFYGVDGVSTGAYSDIQMATSTARAMVVNYGLSERLGPLDYDARDQDSLGSRQVSSHTSRLIDEEVKLITDQCYAKAEGLLADNKDILESMKDALLEYETLDNDQIEDLMERRKIRAPRSWGSDEPSSKDDDAGSVGSSDDSDVVGDPAQEV